MAKIREKKYSWERYPDTYVLSRPSESQKNIIRDAEDGPMAKFYDYDESGNYFTFNTRDFEAHKKDIAEWVKRHPEFDIEKGTFEAMYGDKENYVPEFIKYPNDKYIYVLTDWTEFNDKLETKPYTYEPKDNEIILVDMNLDENKLKEQVNTKSPLDYIEDKLNDNGIEYTVEQAVGDEPYDTWITVENGQDSLADDIICSVVGYAYAWVRDKFGNRKYCKVVTDEYTINELNESLKGNHSFKGLTKKVVEAKETCSQDYLRYKKQLQKAKSIDELRKVWQTIKKDYDADMTPEEDKHLANLFLDRKKELKESLKEATGKIQKVSIIKQGNTKDRYKVLVNATNGKKSEEYLSEDDIKPFVNGLKKRYGDFEIEDPSNTLNDNTDLFKETFNDLVEETKRLMQEEDYDIHDAIYEAVSGLFLDKQIKAIKDYYRSLGNKYIEDGDEWYDCLADDIINDIKYGEGLGENLKKEWKPFGGRVADINSSVGKFDYDFFDEIAEGSTPTFDKEVLELLNIKEKHYFENLQEADDKYFSTKPSNDIKIKKFVREYADEIRDDINNDMYDDYGMWSKYLDMFTIDFPKNKLTTSEFAIKFFDEINKKFGSNFHYGYVKEGLKEDTFDDKMDFLAKDEDEAIDGYKKVIKTVDNQNVKAQLKKIETEEKAHKDYLERVKKNKDIKYTEPLDEE